jgi:hypothetical protein
MEAVRRAFRVFDDGIIFRWVVVCLFVVTALAALVGAVATDFGLLSLLRDATFLHGVALLVLAATLLMGGVAMAAVILFRGAYEVVSRKAEKYALVPLITRMLRVGSEAGFFYFILISPGTCLAVWLGGMGMTAYTAIPALPAGSTFFGGILALLAGVATAFVLLCAGYLVAELLELLVSVANDVSAIRAGKKPS